MAVVTVIEGTRRSAEEAKTGTLGNTSDASVPCGWNGTRMAISSGNRLRLGIGEIAHKAGRKLEEELDLKAMGTEPPKKAEHISIESAVNLYLKDMAQRGIKDSSKPRRMLAWLLDYANEKNVVLLRDVTARLLTEWRSGWTFRKDSDSPSVHWSVAYVDSWTARHISGIAQRRSDA